MILIAAPQRGQHRRSASYTCRINEGVLVGGDLIIGGSVGRTDLPDSVHADLEASIRRVMALPGRTRLLGGHGPESTLEDEARNNPYVRMAMEL